MDAALDLWYDAKVREPGARANSLASYRGRVRHVKAWFGPMLVRQVRPEHLTQFAADQLAAGKAPATVQGIYACLTAALKHAVRRGVIRSVPVPLDGPGIPTPAARDHDLTLAEVETIIDRLPGVWGRVAELILLTGLRWGEVVAIREDDIDGSVLRVRRTQTRYGGVNPPKTKQGSRTVPLSPRAQRLIADLPLPVGGDYRRAHEALVHAMGDLHRPGMGWHSLRNAHATLLDVGGVSLRDQAARLGHGTNYAQSLAYGLRGQAGSADGLDELRRHAAPSPEPEPSGEDELSRRRARRRSAP